MTDEERLREAAKKVFTGGNGPGFGIWDQLPHDAQRALCGQADKAKALELVFNDDGTCRSPRAAGYTLATALLNAQCNYLDTLVMAVEFTESLTLRKAGMPRPLDDKTARLENLALSYEGESMDDRSFSARQMLFVINQLKPTE